MKDEEKLEKLKKGFIETAFKSSDVPFELPIVHIHQDTMPILDHSKDSFEYAIKFIVQRHQEQINSEVMKVIQAIMKEKGISEYYSIDEKRLLEIVEEAKAFEIIKKYPFVVQFIQTKQSYSDLAITMPNTEIPTQEEYDILKRRL